MNGRLLVAALVSMGVAAGGCILVTGGTSGYTLAIPEAGLCQTDAPSALVTCECASAASCAQDGGPVACCLGESLTGSLAAACKATSCGPSAIQLCETSKECDDAACLSQVCTVSSVTIPIQACGAIPAATGIQCTLED
jgi:hypothetical protein